MSCGTVTLLRLLLRSSSVQETARPEPLHGSVGTPALCATMLDAILSPSDHIALSLGPAQHTRTHRYWTPAARTYSMYENIQ